LVGQRTHDGERLWFDVEARPVVQVAQGRLTGWSLSVAVGTHRMHPKTIVESQASGALLRVDPLPDDWPVGLGEVALVSPGGQVAQRWPVRWIVPPNRLLEGVVRARLAGKYDEALAVLTAGPTSSMHRLWGAVERARVAQARETPALAVEAWVWAAGVATELGVPGEAGRRYRAAAHAAYSGRMFARQGALVARARALVNVALSPTDDARCAYAEGLYFHQIGDFRRAAARMTAAVEGLQRFGLGRLAQVVGEARALLWADMGDFAQALATLPEPPSEAQARARHTLNQSWIRLLDPSQPASGPWLLEARRLAQAAGDRLLEANAVTNLAWAALLEGRLPAGLALVAEARRLDPQGAGFGGLFLALIEGELQVAGAPLQALATCEAVERQGRAEVDGRAADTVWRAVLCQAHALARAGREPQALAAYRRALQEVQALARMTPVLGGRAVFHRARRALLDEAIAALIKAGRIGEAFGVADAAQARQLRALQSQARVGALSAAQRARWAAAVEAARAMNVRWQAVLAAQRTSPEQEQGALKQQLARLDAARAAALESAYAVLELGLETAGALHLPALGDARLVLLHRLPDRWVAFDAHRGGVQVRTVAEGADPYAPVGPGAHVYVVPGEHPLGQRAVYEGAAPLIERASVSFLPHSGLLAKPGPVGTGPALVVADAQGDLLWARREGAWVAQRLKGAQALAGAAAHRAAVLAELAGARVLHFAGHGVLNPEDPWAAHLALQGSDRLDLLAVLAHPVTARVVVLNGCHTGVTVGQSVGLAQAFLAAGAHSVVATDRAVPDAVAQAFVHAFYEAGGATQPAVALRTAVRALKASGDADWSAFRLFGLR
jgi:tetratricopeptide (TPR) repeat protein